jgi:hypothetical protein
MKTNTTAIGQQSEAKVLVALVSSGYSVSVPFGNNERYDLVVDYRGIFLRLQIKTGRMNNGVITFKTCSYRGCGPRKHYRGQCDLFGVYVPELDKIYLVPVEDVGKTEGYLRVLKPKKNQKLKVRWAVDYEI